MEMKIKKLSNVERKRFYNDLKIKPTKFLDSNYINYNNKELALEKWLSLSSIEFLLRNFISSEIRKWEWKNDRFIIREDYCYRK